MSNKRIIPKRDTKTPARERKVISRMQGAGMPNRLTSVKEAQDGVTNILGPDFNRVAKESWARAGKRALKRVAAHHKEVNKAGRASAAAARKKGR